MRIAGLQKLTLLDYPGKAAATVFTPCCDLRCPYCQNREIVLGDMGGFPRIPEESVLEFLKKRQGLLDGVCITGGEPTMRPDLAPFLGAVKAMGYAIKLDTNGIRTMKIKSLVQAGLVDYIAVDVKASADRYATTVDVAGFDPKGVLATVDYLLTDPVEYEFRTTVVRELHSHEHLEDIARWISGARAWYLQQFRDSDTVLAGKGVFHAYSDAKMHDIAQDLAAIAPNVHLRGID